MIIMMFLISIVFILALISTLLYARAVYFRRKYLMPKVISFVSNNDNSQYARYVAKSAFIDSLSYKMPIEIINATRQLSEKEIEEVEDKIASDLAANDQSAKELRDIIGMMYRINLVMNIPFWLYLIVCNFKSIKPIDKSGIKQKDVGYISKTLHQC